MLNSCEPFAVEDSEVRKILIILVPLGLSMWASVFQGAFVMFHGSTGIRPEAAAIQPPRRLSYEANQARSADAVQVLMYQDMATARPASSE